jgi:hypothetical protein
VDDRTWLGTNRHAEANIKNRLLEQKINEYRATGLINNGILMSKCVARQCNPWSLRFEDLALYANAFQGAITGPAMGVP